MPAPRPVRFLGSVAAWFGHAGTFILVSLLAGGLFAGLLIPFAAGVGIAARDGAESFQNFEVDSLVVGQLPGRTTMTAANGAPIATFYRENRQERTLAQIAPQLQQALLAIEDRRFYEHGPVDLRGILRALVTNLSAGEVEEGASTLTMQYARNLLVIEAGDDEQELAAALATTPERKIAEIKYAIALEEEYTKDEILQGYLNTVFFGNRSYGVEMASINYFNVPSSQLTLPQAATLAGLVQDPNSLDPTRNPAGAADRRNVVLDAMVTAGFITDQEATDAKATPLVLTPAPPRNGCLQARNMARFCDYAYNWLLTRPELGATVEERQTRLQTGGLQIKTTMQPIAQSAAINAIAEYVEATNVVSAAEVVVQPGTGQVLAVATSKLFGEDTTIGETTVNYAVDAEYGESNGFQAGSTFKIFTLTAAMAEGLSLYDRFPGQQTEYTGFKSCVDGTTPEPPYEPANSTGNIAGDITLLEATARSVNSAFVGLEELITQCKAADMAERLGMRQSDGNPLGRFPTFTLGVDEVSPLRMAESIATLAARGLHCTAYPVTEVKDRDGTVLLAPQPACEQVIPQPVADATNFALQGVMTGRGTGARMALDRPAAGKTGTTNDNIAVWFAGFTPNLAAAVWVGNPDSNQYPLENITLNGRFYSGPVFGGTVPGPIWHNTMQEILTSMEIPVASFADVLPEFIEGRPVEVPAVLGLSVAAASEILEGLGFVVEVAPGREFSDYPKDSVARTAPAAGTEVPFGSTITIHVSGGKQGGGGGGGCPPRQIICPP